MFTQDAIQKTQQKWNFTKYDNLGRVAYTGIYTHDLEKSQAQMQSHFNALNDTAEELYETKVSTGAGFDGTYYENSNFPDNNLEVLTVNYYDNYTFNRAGAPTSVNVYGVNSTTNLKSLATGSRIKVLDQSPQKWITTVTYYDEKARPIYMYSKNEYLETTDIVENKLDFVGKTLETKTIHSKTDQEEDIVTIDIFSYDRVGRLLDQYQCIGDGSLTSCSGVSNFPNNITLTSPLDLTQNETQIIAKQSITLAAGFEAAPSANQSVVFTIDADAPAAAELIVSNSYDELGQLKSKKVGNSKDAPLQTVDYTYNIRGWLTNINQDTQNDSDLFNFTLRYNNPTTGTALYNGNISQTSWNTANVDSGTKTYSYAYDALNRITGATGATTSNYNVSGISYDKNGNIKTLNRNGWKNSSNYSDMDKLIYTYDSGNKLKKVKDNGNDTYGFKDGIDTTTEYVYDINGNMTKDDNKQITSIIYNHLNLPTKVTIQGKEINYIYDAAGLKLSKLVEGDLENEITQYAGNFIYKSIHEQTEEPNFELQFFNHAEGYVQKEDNNFSYIYQYKDHLGNVRLSYSDTNNDGVITASSDPSTNEIIEESNYYPFGLEHKGYNNVINGAENDFHTYNGKEHEKSLGLNWHDYGARRYDASIGRWMSTDPYAEKYETLSPYTYVANNPVNAIDPDGRLIIYVNGLLAKQYAGWKFFSRSGGEFVGHYAYPPPRSFQRNGITMFGQSVPYWVGDKGTIGIINNHFDDNNNLFINATDVNGSQASDRFAQGQVSGLELIERFRNGEILKNNEETIKIVGHSQGAAFAAGIIDALANSEYASRVELGLYLSSHQPGGFEHNSKVSGAQLSTRSDWISSKGSPFLKNSASNVLFKGLMNALNGQSEISEIEGVDFLFIRPNHDDGLGGHSVETWNTILQRISDFLKDDDDK